MWSCALHAEIISDERLQLDSTVCDACGTALYASRLVCLDCDPATTLDFCDNASCYGTVITRSDIVSPHLPTHNFMKMRKDIMYWLEIGKVFNDAKDGMEWANKLLNRVEKESNQGTKCDELGDLGPNSDSPPSPPAMACLLCASHISRPCWYCVDCSG